MNKALKLLPLIIASGILYYLGYSTGEDHAITHYSMYFFLNKDLEFESDACKEITEMENGIVKEKRWHAYDKTGRFYLSHSEPLGIHGCEEFYSLFVYNTDNSISSRNSKFSDFIIHGVR